ncbi:hypothetical protein LCGC14_1309120 [marine sediment metagenome]|uniref:Uncharacterized protein n=1 Tax=marine sediment metagenome TaxID=412755 RepID=A0A0F9NQD4_9ZZZZ
MDTAIENFDYPDEISTPSIVETLRDLASQIEYLSDKVPHSEWVFIANPIWFTPLQLKFIDLPPLMKTKTRLMVKMSWLANRLLWQIMAQ